MDSPHPRITLHRIASVVGLIVITAACSGCAGIRPPKNARGVELTLEATGYCRCGRCCGWKRNWYFKPVYSGGASKGERKQVGITASGTRAKRGTIAADTRVYPFGTVMYIPGYGYGRVEDRGGAIKGKRIDLFFASHKQALVWGRKRVKVKIWRPKDK